MADIRLNKYLADAGIASRRGSDALIADGCIAINGVTVDQAGAKVSAGDVVTHNGNVVNGEPRLQLWCYYKPVGTICTHHDPQGRPTVFDALPEYLGRVISVGRLDVSSEGLLLLTNNGDVARMFELPSSSYERIYRVRIRGALSDDACAAIEEGVTIDDVHYQPISVQKERGGKSNNWVRMTLTEGKNREIRRIMEHFGHPVSRLIRVSYGEYVVGNMEPGEVREVNNAHSMLIEQLRQLNE